MIMGMGGWPVSVRRVRRLRRPCVLALQLQGMMFSACHHRLALCLSRLGRRRTLQRANSACSSGWPAVRRHAALRLVRHSRRLRLSAQPPSSRTLGQAPYLAHQAQPVLLASQWASGSLCHCRHRAVLPVLPISITAALAPMVLAAAVVLSHGLLWRRHVWMAGAPGALIWMFRAPSCMQNY